jgi:hypothetical protein
MHEHRYSQTPYETSSFRHNNDVPFGSKITRRSFIKTTGNGGSEQVLWCFTYIIDAPIGTKWQQPVGKVPRPPGNLLDKGTNPNPKNDTCNKPD